MGTHCEIHVRSKEVDVELWKHWDGYPDYMMPYFKEFAKWVREQVGDQKHWLLYPEDVSAYLIAFDWERSKKWAEKMRGEGYEVHERPDVRPRGRANEMDYLYIIDLGETWTITCYECRRGLTEEERELIRNRREGEVKGLVKVRKERVPMIRKEELPALMREIVELEEESTAVIQKGA